MNNITIERLEKEAKDRHEIHKNHSTSRPLSKDYELVGLAGELALSKFLGIPMDLELRPGGDNRKDFDTPIGTMDVKTARKAYNLLRESGKIHADILVLAEYNDETKVAKLIGWEYDQIVVKFPRKDFGYGIINHYIPRELLKPMKELKEKLNK